MELTYNGLGRANATNLVTFTDIPNILKVTDSTVGTKTKLTLTFSGNITTFPTSGTPSITMFGETITGVRSYGDAINRSFFMSSSPVNTAVSVSKALRNCPGIISLFTIEYSSPSKVILNARNVGSLLGGGTYYETNIPGNMLSISGTDGTAPSLNGASVGVDVFYSNGTYVTTLEKSFYGGECAFNVSPVLTTMANIGHTVGYKLEVYSVDKSGVYSFVGRLTNNMIAQGYMVNQGMKYIPLGANVEIAQNMARGNDRGVYNHSLLYLYGDTIPLSLYATHTGSGSIGISYKNSAYEEFASGSSSYAVGSDRLVNTTIYLDRTNLDKSFYVDITVGGKVIRYNVIKPVKATEYYQRIYWRNSYGGVSFFDFTGQKSETRDADIETYQKNIFDYYTDPMNELEKVYDNKIKYTVTLKSHLFENDGKYIFNDLMQSPEVWTEINGEKYAIIIDNVNVDEIERNDIYEASVKYHYSQEPSLI